MRLERAALSTGAGAADAALLVEGLLVVCAGACVGVDVEVVTGLALAIVLVSYFLAGTEANFQFLQLALFDDTVTDGV